MSRIDEVYDEDSEQVILLIDGTPIFKMTVYEFTVFFIVTGSLLDKIRVNALLKPYPVSEETELTIKDLLRK